MSPNGEVCSIQNLIEHWWVQKLGKILFVGVHYLIMNKQYNVIVELLECVDITYSIIKIIWK